MRFGSYFITLMTIFAFVSDHARAQSMTPVEDNREQLVEMALQGTVSSPTLGSNYRVTATGDVESVPEIGGIVYNARVGTNAVNLIANHVEPAVSIRNGARNSPENRALNVLSTIGAPVKVISGSAKGAKGRVIGKHGGAEHIMVDFKDGTLEKLVEADKFQVRASGQGMKFTNVKDVRVLNIHPDLVDALTERGMGVTEDGKLRVPVALFVPARIMGSGLGRDNAYTGDYDIQLFDDAIVEEYGLDKLRFGDLVAIVNADTTFGRIYKTGAITIGVVSHSISRSAGHGPGVASIFTSTNGNIEPYQDEDANLNSLLNIR